MATRSKKSKPRAAAKKGVRKVRKSGTRNMAKSCGCRGGGLVI